MNAQVAYVKQRPRIEVLSRYEIYEEETKKETRSPWSMVGGNRSVLLQAVRVDSR